MATQADILEAVRSRLDEPTSKYWTDVDLRRWINEGARDVARRTESLRVNTTAAVTAGTATYTPSFTNGQPVRIHEVEWLPDGDTNVYPLTYRDRNAAPEVWGTWQDISEGYPVLWTSWGYPPSLSIQLYPTPSTDGDIRVWYYRQSTDLATATTASAASTVDIPAGWEDVIVDHVEYKALRRDQDPRWSEAKQEYEQHLSALADAALRFNDQAGMIISATGAGVPSWIWAGGDDF